MNFKEHIKKLEKLENNQRADYILEFLDQNAIQYQVQSFKTYFWLGRNIIVDFPFDFKESDGEKLLVSAHHNKFYSSPGANDNASGVSILLEIIKKLKNTKLNKPLRLVFFDLEDGCLPASLLGSKAYIKKFGVADLSFVLNVDSVGIGDSLLIEGIKQDSASSYFNNLVKFAKQESFLVDIFEKPYYGIHSLNLALFLSDHTTFLFNGFKDACSISTDRKQDLAFRDIVTKEKWWELFKIKVFHPEMLSYKWKHYHNKLDTSETLSEETLSKVFRVVWKLVSQ